jgi:hypothetical protein
MPSSPEIDGQTPRKRSKRRRSTSESTPEQPDFLLSFPQSPELEPAVDAFLNGNYREVRRVCDNLLERDLDPDVQSAARELLRRLTPDPLIKGILWGSFVLLALIVLWAYGQ